MPSTTRRCPSCEQHLPFTTEHFYISDTGRLNASYCRPCHLAYHRARPRTTVDSRRFGVELEFMGERYALIREMQSRGLRVQANAYRAGTPSTWKIVSDLSVPGGAELVSPPLKGAAGRKQVKLACEAMEAAGCSVNRACGLHVHHDVNDLDRRAFGRLFRAWSGAQRATDQLVSASRRGGRWAMPLTESDLAVIEGLPIGDPAMRDRYYAIRVDRFKSLNVQAYPKYGTVEVRQHQGTINAKKVLAWVELGQAFIKLAKGHADVQTHGQATDLLAQLQSDGGLKANTASYLRTRAAQLTGGRRVVAA